MRTTRTIFALSSGRPPAAIAIIRISGPDAHRAGTLVAGSMADARVAAMRPLRRPQSGELIDHGLVIRFDAPASATGEDVVEIQCHGGRAVVEGLLTALREIEGLREAQPGEFTRRAFENGRIDFTEAEGLADLIEAETQSQRRAALLMADGRLRRQIERWQEHVLALSARAEQAIDYDDDDHAFDTSLLSGCEQLSKELDRWLELPRVEPLRNGVLVVVGGPVNAGKSSLVNMIAGAEKAIVTAVAGTTRDSIEVPLSLAGLPIRLIDTAGIRESDDEVETIGVHRAERMIEAADVLLWLGAPETAPEHPRRIKVHGKADLPGREVAPKDSLAVSSVTAAGLDQLLMEVTRLARSVLPDEHEIALNMRQVEHLTYARDALAEVESTGDLVLCAENLRQARHALDRLTGCAGVEDLLDALFSRFCLGK